MILKPISRLQPADILDLVVNQVREGRLIDYKRDLVGNTDQDKKEFLADVSSFANTSGGHLLIGIAEAEGIPTEVRGVAPENMDREIQRLENMIRAGLDPRLPMVSIAPFDTGAGSHVIVVEVAQSFSAPHRVIFGNHGQFYGRNSAGKHQFDVDELRRAFTLSGTLAERTREFQTNRLRMLRLRHNPPPLNAGAIAAMHIVPAGALMGRHTLDLRDHEAVRVVPMGAPHQHISRLNLDGRFTYLAENQGCAALSQVFRSGIIELAMVFPAMGADPVIPSAVLEKAIIDGIDGTLNFYRRHEVGPPLFIFLAILDVFPYRLAVNPQNVWQGAGAMRLDRDDLIFPEILLEELDDDVRGEVVVRPLIDQIWQAWGHQGSPNFDQDGRWNARRF